MKRVDFRNWHVSKKLTAILRSALVRSADCAHEADDFACVPEA